MHMTKFHLSKLAVVLPLQSMTEQGIRLTAGFAPYDQYEVSIPFVSCFTCTQPSYALRVARRLLQA